MFIPSHACTHTHRHCLYQLLTKTHTAEVIRLLYLLFNMLIHLPSGCLFRSNWKKDFCGRMLWFWLNQVFRQISPCQRRHSLPEVVTFVGWRELALKQIMKQMFYAKSESRDTQATANKTLLLSVQSFQFPAAWNMNFPTNGRCAVQHSRENKCHSCTKGWKAPSLGLPFSPRLSGDTWEPLPMKGDGVCKDKSPPAQITGILCIRLGEKEVHRAVPTGHIH